MRPRFHVPDASPGRTHVDLPPDEARHLWRVLRLGVGAEIVVFDGQGHEFEAAVEAASRRGVRVRLVAPSEPAHEPAVPLTLVQGVLKGDHMDRVVRDAVMMGVAVVQPVITAHGQVPLGALERGRGRDRWRRIAVASAKQCRRAVVPAIHPARTFEEVVADPPADDERRVLLVEPAAAVSDTRRPADLGSLGVPSRATLAVGAEGGWSQQEISAALGHGFVPLTLGRRTLRADAVPVAAIAVLQFVWGDL